MQPGQVEAWVPVDSEVHRFGASSGARKKAKEGAGVPARFGAALFRHRHGLVGQAAGGCFTRSSATTRNRCGGCTALTPGDTIATTAITTSNIVNTVP